MPGSLYLIPGPISSEGGIHLTELSKDLLSRIKLFFVENQKVSRGLLKKICPEINLDEIEMVETGKYADIEFWNEAMEQIYLGRDAALVSDAGCPGIGDPGNEIILMAHNSGLRVVPLAGPNSFILALMASGLNGQQFRFHGYLPINKIERRKKIQLLSQEVGKTGESQIFMETPYRNQQLLDDILKESKGTLKLCLASDITGANEEVLTLTVSDWKKMDKKAGKIPMVFILGS